MASAGMEKSTETSAYFESTVTPLPYHPPNRRFSEVLGLVWDLN